MKYKRVLLKLSGEALSGDEKFGIQPLVIDAFAKEIKEVVETGVELAVVIGGGNIFRGIQGALEGMNRANSDYMGMLATIINGMALQNILEKNEVKTRLLSALQVNQVCEPYIRRRAVRHLEKGRVVILAAGTGNPFFTTDTAASLRAIELDADVVLKGTKVDGVYSADPEIDKNAVKFDNISFSEVLSNRLNVMDMTAFTLCQENELPIIVYNAYKKGVLKNIIEGKHEGTLVH